MVRFNLGDFVLRKNEERNQTKLDPKFKGPFVITGFWKEIDIF